MEIVFLLIVLVIVLGILTVTIADPQKGHLSDANRDKPKASRDAKPEGKQQKGPFNAASAKPVRRTISGHASIVDGDTLRIRGTQIRLFGINAPEIDHPDGQKSKWALVRLCKGHVVRAEILEADHYGRTVAKCLLPDGRDLSAEMVKIGLAIDWPKFSGGIYTRLEQPGVRKRLWLADARQKGRMHVWKKYDAWKASQEN